MGTQSGHRRIRPFADSCREIWDALEPVRGKVRSRFAIDTRSLAALRIALGSIILFDLLHRAAYIELFYTDSGVYSLAAYEATYSRYTGLSIHAASGELWFQQLVFAIAGLFAIALILGYRTRLVGFVSLVLLLSLHARNPSVLNGGDRLLWVLLLVSLVSPLGERWSIDALRRGSARPAVVSFGTAALLAQPLAVFCSNAILKQGGENWYAGEAVRIALANDVMTVHLGNSLGAYPALLEVLNWAWVILLAGSLAFLLLPVGRLRALFALAYMGAFAGMLASLSVGLFPFVLAASVIPFLTAPFWETAARLVPSRWADRRPSASWLGPFTRPPAEHRALDVLRTRGYDSLASFTVEFGRSLLTVVGVMVLLWIVLFSASYVADADLPDEIDNAHLDQQRWGLYAPDPSESYSWYVVEAELASGGTVDAHEGGNVTMDRPPDASQEYDTFRHRKFMQTVRDSGREGTLDVVAEEYADHACVRANAQHGGQVEQVTVYRLIQPSPVDGEYEDPNRLTVIERDC
ncbi:HTTM domain-containing protein [Natronococcus wangiae]|uniref:HTTM domain-containing protein n=1 Tax=Natronococcus wangiae TaxID=3068275 RepID=UPI00273FA78E|nr:HTTM domain-containing protein [Natronococcus sp. AD5]